MAKQPLSEKLNNTLKIFIIAAITVGIILGIFSSMIVSRGVQQSLATISVDGQHTITVDPEQVEIRFQTREEGKDISELQNENAVKINGLKTSLDNLGIKYEIETLSFNIYPEYDWTNGKRIFRTNVLTQTVKITSKSIDKAGELIDTGINADIGIVQGISFSLTDEKMEELRNEAQAEALKKAKAKAKQMAKAGGFRLIAIRGVNAGGRGYYPMPMMEKAVMSGVTMDMDEDAYIPTEIQPTNLEITSSASITYSIK